MTDRDPRLLVDIQTVQGGFFGNRGIRRFALGFARALLDRGIARALLLNPGRPWLEEFPSEIRNVGELSWTTRRALRELDGDGATAYVMTSPFERTTPAESAMPSYVVESGLPIVMVLYDLIPEVVDVYPSSLMPEYWARRRLVKEADLLLTLSDHVRRDAVDRLHVPAERVSVIGAAASDFFRPQRPGEQPSRLLTEHVPRITRPFVLSVTGWLAHKNAHGLIEAWSRLPRPVRGQHQLVLTCPLPPGAEEVWNDLAAGFGLAPDDVIVTDQVDDRVVRALYQQAELFVLPSYEEGFGLPVLEAARCGCPAVTSSASSLPEVLGWDPATFAPEQVDGIAETLERGLLDPVFRADLRAVGDAAARRHTWDRVAERTSRACTGMPAPRRPARVPPLRIALVGSLTPSTTSSAIAFDRVAALLPGECAVDRFDTAATRRTPSNVASSDTRPRGVGSYPARALAQVRDPWGYDAIVYIVDGHPSRELLDLARTHPGVVWFVEAPGDHLVVAELARGALVIVRPSDVSALAVDPGPFGRAVPVVAVPDHGTSAERALLETIGLLTAPAVSQAAR
jgi:glycosyltransferase involved in cell wall biosynthesis